MIDHDGQAYASPTYLLTSIPDFLRSTNYRMLADGMLLQDIRAAEEGIADWRDWCAFFIGLARAHEQLASQSLVNGRALTASEHLVRGALCAHYGQFLYFGFPEVKIGFVPAMVAAMVRRNMSEKDAFAILTLGYETAGTALKDAGVVHDIFNDETFDEDVLAFAKQYEKLSGSAVAMTKRLLARVDGLSFPEALDKGVETNARARMTDDCKKGIAKFLEK